MSITKCSHSVQYARKDTPRTESQSLVQGPKSGKTVSRGCPLSNRLPFVRAFSSLQLNKSALPIMSAQITAVRAMAIPLLLAVAFVSLALWVERSGRSVGLIGLTSFAAAGAFALLSAGWQRTKAKGEGNLGPDQLSIYCSDWVEGLLLVGSDGLVAFSNPAFWELLGADAPVSHQFNPAISLGRILGRSDATYRLLRAAENHLNWEEVIEQPVGAGGEAVSRWLRLSVTWGSVYSAWRVSDVTLDHTRQNESLQRARRQLDQLDALPAGIFLSTADGRLTYANASLANQFGFDRAAVDGGGLTLEQILPRDIRSALVVELAGTTLGGATSFEVNWQPPRGTSAKVRMLVRTHSGTTKPAAGMLLEEISNSPEGSNAQAAEDRFTRLFRAAPIAIATVGGDGRIGSANHAFENMFFESPADKSQGEQLLLEQFHGADQIKVRAALEAAARGDRLLQPIEVTVGESKRRAAQLFLSHNSSGVERDSVVIYALDTTERKELEVQFAQSQKMQAIGQLAGGIAHDINNVLTVIIGFSDLLLANSAGDPAFHDLNEIKANANRAANLVRQLLAFSRRQTLRPEVLSLNEVISELSVFLKRSLGEKVKLERDYGRDLWLVRADQTELGRVLINLAVNAVDAMPMGGTLTIRTCNMDRASVAKLGLNGLSAADYVLCEVVDTGHGMSPEVLQKIFEPFFTTKEVGKGTGLGLSTVYGIIKQTGGSIYCDSTLGQGTRFRIFLPRHAAGSGSLEPLPKTERKEKPRDLTGSGSVLLVEDEESVRRFAARALRRQGYVVLEAGNGVEALAVKAAYEGVIDLVVSDIVMPEMDGPTLLKELRQTNPDLKIIFMSGYADDALSSLDGGEEFAFLSKPFQLAELVSAVKELMFG